MKLRTKILLTATTGPILCVLAMMGTVLIKSGQIKRDVHAQFIEQGYAEALRVTESAASLVANTDAMLRDDLHKALALGQYTIATAGGITGTTNTQQWTAVNQETEASTVLELPLLQLGNTPLTPVYDMKASVPVADMLTSICGVTCSVFQRMNDAGDMLRIVSSTKARDGRRGIGRYIPARAADGSGNPIVETVLRGETYTGASVVNGEHHLSSYLPLRDRTGNLIGMLGVGFQQDRIETLRAAIMKLQLGKSGYAYVLGGTGHLKYHYIISKDGKRDGEDLAQVTNSEGRAIACEQVDGALKLKSGAFGRIHYAWKNTGETEERQKVMAYSYYEPWGWVIGAGTYEDDFTDEIVAMDAHVRTMLLLTGLVGLLLTVAALALACWNSNRILRPLAKVQLALREIAQGEGDLTRRMTIDSNDEIGELAGWFNRFLDALRSLIGEVLNATHEVAAGAEQIARTSNAMSHDVAEQTAMTTEISTAIEELSGSVSSISQTTSETAEQAGAAGEQARQGREVIQRTIVGINSIAQIVEQSGTSVTELNGNSEKIGEIIGVIDQIADQTNLLALNAAIEAARAGDHGRGFSVVADEVRKLAERTMRATAEVTGTVRSIQTRTREAAEQMNRGTTEVERDVQLAAEAGHALESITGNANELAGRIQTIAAGVEQQSAATEQISRSLDSMRQSALQVDAGLRETADAARGLNEKSEHLRGLVGRFKV